MLPRAGDIMYTHRTYRTRLYCDPGCAAYKLMRFLESFIGNNNVIWRVKPKVVGVQDFEDEYRRFAGVARLTVVRET